VSAELRSAIDNWLDHTDGDQASTDRFAQAITAYAEDIRARIITRLTEDQ
jgi:hypothetical protein